MPAHVRSFCLSAPFGHVAKGIAPTAIPVTIEADTIRRLPCLVIIGIPAAVVRDTADRVRMAIHAAGFEFPRCRVMVNVAPGDVRKLSTGDLDLPIALAILKAGGLLHADYGDGSAFVGGLGLDGLIVPCPHAEEYAALATAQGLDLRTAASLSALLGA